MGNYFSDVVDKAIEDLYYCCDNDRAKAAAEALLQAAKEGDGDACYFLSRCFSGSCYSWEYHPFEENKAAAYAMLRESVAKGSAVGVLGAIRMDMLTPEMRSTGEVMGLADDLGMAFAKSQMAAQPGLPGSGNVFISVKDHDKEAAAEIARRFHELGFKLFSTSGTAQFLRGKGIPYVNGRGRGDQYVTVVVETPARLTREQKDLLKRFDELSSDSTQPKRKKFFDKLRDLFEK